MKCVLLFFKYRKFRHETSNKLTQLRHSSRIFGCFSLIKSEIKLLNVTCSIVEEIRQDGKILHLFVNIKDFWRRIRREKCRLQRSLDKNFLFFSVSKLKKMTFLPLIYIIIIINMLNFQTRIGTKNSTKFIGKKMIDCQAMSSFCHFLFHFFRIFCFSSVNILRKLSICIILLLG